MKFQRIGVVSAICAAAAFMGCSSDQANKGVDHNASIGFNLTTSDGVVITSVNYDLNTQGGADVVSGSIPVPNPDSTISLGIDSLGAGAYTLAFSATGTKGSQSYSCVTKTASLFSLAANQDLTLPPVTLTCTTTVASGDTTGSVKADVNVAVETITVNGNVVETFTYGPRSVKGTFAGGVCSFPPIALNVANTDTTISYAWTASPDGTLALNATNTSGTYTCQTGGTKTLTLKGTKGSITSSKPVTVTCDDSACTSSGTGGTGGAGTGGSGGAGAGAGGTSAGTGGTGTGPTCGDGHIDTSLGEECDDATSRCVACKIVPVCGDGIVDGPNGACSGGVNKAACSEQCDTAGASDTCDATCHTIAPKCSTQWLACINADANLGPVQAQYCDSSCLAVEKCVVDNGKCFSPVAAQCYCGIGADIDACKLGGTPTGPCVNEIKTGENNPATNQDALNLFFDFSVPTGVGMQIIDASKTTCTISCP